jgi:general secretion pathway protein K
MKRSPLSDGKDPQKERGSALLMVVWSVGVLAALGALVAGDTFMDVQEANSARDSFLARALAQDGLRLSSSAWSDPTSPVHDNLPFTCTTQTGTIRLQVRSTSALIDLNMASERLLAGLFEALGTGPDEARRLGAAVADYRDPDNIARTGGYEADLYRANGLPGPANRAFMRPAELASVVGMSNALVSSALPHVTTYNGSPGIETTNADPVVARAVSIAHGLGPGTARVDTERGKDRSRKAQDAPPYASTRAKSILVTSEGRTRSGHVAVAEATLSSGANRAVFDKLETFRWAPASSQARRAGFADTPAPCY